MAPFTLAQAAGLTVYTVLVSILAPRLLSNVSTAPSIHLSSFIGDFPLPDYPLTIPLRFFNSNNTATTTTNSSSSQSNISSTSTSPTTNDNPSHLEPDSPDTSNEDNSEPFTCDPHHSYQTSLVSLSPLVIYIHNLLTPREISSLLRTATPLFNPSAVTKPGHVSNVRTSDRTSSSAGLPKSDPAVQCVLSRARTFLGTMLRDSYDEMGPPQLVRYNKTGQRFNLHHDWFDTPRWADDDNRKWNRVASFFAILEDNCTGGETHFPYLKPGVVEKSSRGEKLFSGLSLPGVFQGGGDINEGGRGDQGDKEEKPLWREHEEGGLAFRPVAGNALFWVNLHENGTGDTRTNHAGLPLGEGVKTAMNIWPRQYYED